MLNFQRFGLALASLSTTIIFYSSAQALTSTTIAPTHPAESNQIAGTQRSGRIRVVYAETNDPFSKELTQAYQQYLVFEKIGKLITSEINLPHDITVVLGDCGTPNAFYSGKERTITMCNELTKQKYELLQENGYSKEDALRTAIFASFFFFFHESGHMLIHQLNLPIVGAEEDAADRFSFVFLLLNDSSEDKSIFSEILMAAGALFNLQSAIPDLETIQDPHPLNQQRFYNIVCLLYGSNPEKYRDLVAKLNYQESRLNSCEEESKFTSLSWRRLLQPYLKID